MHVFCCLSSVVVLTDMFVNLRDLERTPTTRSRRFRPKGNTARPHVVIMRGCSVFHRMAPGPHVRAASQLRPRSPKRGIRRVLSPVGVLGWLPSSLVLLTFLPLALVLGSYVVVGILWRMCVAEKVFLQSPAGISSSPRSARRSDCCHSRTHGYRSQKDAVCGRYLGSAWQAVVAKWKAWQHGEASLNFAGRFGRVETDRFALAGLSSMHPSIPCTAHALFFSLYFCPFPRFGASSLAGLHPRLLETHVGCRRPDPGSSE